MSIISTSGVLCCVLLVALSAFCLAQSDYEEFPDIGYYKVHLERETWGKAWSICKAEAAHLGIINDDTEAFVFSGLFSRHFEEQYCHIGFHDLYLEGSYVSTYDVALNTGYFKWAAGNPGANATLENCGSITQGGFLNDIACDAKHIFICERDFVKSFANTVVASQVWIALGVVAHFSSKIFM